jgi:hypothetical protein
MKGAEKSTFVKCGRVIATQATDLPFLAAEQERVGLQDGGILSRPLSDHALE